VVVLVALVVIVGTAIAGVALYDASPLHSGPKATTSIQPLRVPKPPASAMKVTPIAGKQKPNIVFIVTDDMRTDELKYMPHVRKLLVDKGTDFTKAISPHPLCCPARAEMTTGEYAQNNGVHHNNGTLGGYPALIEPGNNIGRWLQHAGYWTAFIGKYLNAYKGTKRIAGWNRWEAAIHDVYQYHRVNYYGVGPIKGYAAHTTTRYTQKAISAGHRSGKPFYVVSNYLAPHDQIGTGGRASQPVPEAKYKHACDHIRPAFLHDPAYMKPVRNGLPPGMNIQDHTSSVYVHEARQRICSLKSVDDGVAKIVNTLRSTGELNDTDIVFVSDNGFDLGEHNLHGKNMITDESLQVPIVIRGPHFPVDRKVSKPASLVDLPATYLQLGEAVPGRRQDGLSLLKVLQSKKPLRDTLLVQTGDTVLDSTPGFAYRGVDTQRYLYAIDPSKPSIGLLFDRQRDPHAMDNVFNDPRYAAVRAALQKRLEALMPCSGSNCNQVFGPLPKPRG